MYICYSEMSKMLSAAGPVLCLRSLSTSSLVSNVYFSRSRTAITRKPMFENRQVFENAMQKKIYKDAVLHHPYPVRVLY